MRGTIVCGVTGGAEGRAAAQLAAALAARLETRLVLVHVLPHGQHRREAEEMLATVAGGLGGAEVRIGAGNRVDALAQVAADEGADVIILGSRTRGARGRQLRCTLACELEAAQPVPVLVAPPATRARSSRRLALAQVAAER